jgi:chromosome partitioning protein
LYNKLGDLGLELFVNIVSFVNMKGGVGKTTLAVNVADALNRRLEKRVLLVDLDPQFNATQCLFSGDEYLARLKSGDSTIADIFTDTSTYVVDPIEGKIEVPPKKLSEIKPWEHHTGLHLIPGNLEIYKIDMGQGQGREMRLRRFLTKEYPKDDYDIVIVDTPPTPSQFMHSALMASDHYLLPVKPEPLSRVGIDLLRGVVDRVTENHAHEIKCAGVVITLADRRTTVFDDAKEFLDKDPYWKGKRFRADLPHRTKIARDQGSQGLILDGGNADAMTALMSITNQLLKRLSDD